MFIRTKCNEIININNCEIISKSGNTIKCKFINNNSPITIYTNEDETILERVFNSLVVEINVSGDTSKIISFEGLEKTRKNLYFENGLGAWELLVKNVTEQEANKYMYDYIQRKNFKSYYTRCWYDEKGNLWTDYGSHSTFFVWGWKE